MRTIIYCRVSTEDQANSGVSLAVQREKCLQYATLRDLTVTKIIEDPGYSAKSLKRPGLQTALDLLFTNDALLIFKLDRLTRNVADIGLLVERHFQPGGATLISVNDDINTGTATGRAMLNIITTMAQWEREANAERVKAAFAHKRTRGEKLGGRRPFGADEVIGDDGRVKLIPRREEVAAYEDMVRMKAAGYSNRAIADLLDVDVSESTVRRVLERGLPRFAAAAE